MHVVVVFYCRHGYSRIGADAMVKLETAVEAVETIKPIAIVVEKRGAFISILQ